MCFHDFFSPSTSAEEKSAAKRRKTKSKSAAKKGSKVSRKSK